MTVKLNGLTSPASTPTYVDNTPTTWTPAGEAATVTYDSLSLAIENNVNVSNKEVPLTGLYSVEDEISGWKWDRRRLEQDPIPQIHYNTYLGGHEAGLLDGTQLEQWQSGVLKDIRYKDLNHLKKGEFLTWTPRFETGKFTTYYDDRVLYSDFSFSANMSTDAIENGVLYHELRADAVLSTVTVALYTRDTDSRIMQKIDFEYVDEFTGVLSGGARVDTEPAGTILWDQLETRKPEFVIRDDRVYLNDDWSVSVGKVSDNLTFDTVDPSLFEVFMEKGGTGVGSGRDIYTKLFPVMSGSVRVIAKDAANNTTEYTEVANLDFSAPTDLHFSVDYDLGIITMGGYQAPDLRLAEELLVSDTEIVVYFDELVLSAYPQQGVLVIGDEEIAYYGRTKDTFYNCVRGFNNTTAAAAAVGAKVQDRQHGRGTDLELYVCYTAVPRVEYEVTDYDCRTANKSRWLDVRPGANVHTNNIVQILSADPNLQQVILETDTPLIGGRLHGTLFYGTDISRLTARGLDSLGNPVEDIDLTIDILSGPGLLNGRTTSFTDISNSLGEIYAFYNSPYDKESIELLVSDVTHSGGNTIMTVNALDSTPDVTEIWVFQVLKHDPVTGSVGDRIDITGRAASTTITGANGYIDLDGYIDQSYRDGWLYVVGTDTVSYTRNIVAITEEINGSGELFSRVWIDFELSAVVVGETARFYQPDAVEWKASALNGSRHILYEYRDDVRHPLTMELGAYYPVQPDSISGNILTFNGRLLPIPDKNDVTNNLGAYVVVAPALARLQAYGRDPVSGRVVQSNIIELLLDLPPFLSGVDSSGALPIPYGWKLITDEFNVGSGIGGANFITINPAADGINQFSLRGVI